MVRTSVLVAALLAPLAVVGCGGGGQPPVKVQPLSGVEQAKAVLRGYAKGDPVGSEVMTFPDIVEEVRKADPAKAEMLKQAFDELPKATPANRAARAKALLGKL